MLDLNGSGAPKMPDDGYMWICRAGTTSHRGRFRPGTSLLGLFGDGRQGYSAPESTPAGRLSGECRFRDVRATGLSSRAGARWDVVGRAGQAPAG